MRRSTFNWINGDEPLSSFMKASWILLNRLSNEMPQPRIQDLRPFRSRQTYYPSDDTPDVCSPSRVLSNAFWKSLSSAQIRKALGEVHLLDVGCGKGNYKDLLDRSIGPIASYLGVDVRRRHEWDGITSDDSRSRFVVASATLIPAEAIDRTNFIFSQSAIEHLAEDLLFFDRVVESLSRFHRSLIQVHLLPPPLLWRLYGPHGFRGYNARALLRIINKFKGSNCCVFLLGGPRCNRVHYDWIADYAAEGQRDRRSEAPRIYAEANAAAVKADLDAGSTSLSDASYLALVICSNTDSLRAQSLAHEETTEAMAVR